MGMIKNLSNRERNRRMLLKMYNSFANKLQGESLIWWNGLSLKAQYSLLFKWLFYKKYNKQRGKSVKVSKFIKIHKKGYRPTISRYREAKIDMICQ